METLNSPLSQTLILANTLFMMNIKFEYREKHTEIKSEHYQYDETVRQSVFYAKDSLRFDVSGNMGVAGSKLTAHRGDLIFGSEKLELGEEGDLLTGGGRAVGNLLIMYAEEEHSKTLIPSYSKTVKAFRYGKRNDENTKKPEWCGESGLTAELRDYCNSWEDKTDERHKLGGLPLYMKNRSKIRTVIDPILSELRAAGGSLSINAGNLAMMGVKGNFQDGFHANVATLSLLQAPKKVQTATSEFDLRLSLTNKINIFARGECIRAGEGVGAWGYA